MSNVARCRAAVAPPGCRPRVVRNGAGSRAAPGAKDTAARPVALGAEDTAAGPVALGASSPVTVRWPAAFGEAYPVGTLIPAALAPVPTTRLRRGVVGGCR